MLREVLTHSPVLFIPLASLFLFLGVFLGALLMTYGRRAAAFEDVSRLPIDEEDQS